MLLAILLIINANWAAKELFVGPLRLGESAHSVGEAFGSGPLTRKCRPVGGDQICAWVGQWSDHTGTVHLEFTDEKVPALLHIILTNRRTPGYGSLKRGISPIQQWRWFGGPVFSVPRDVRGWTRDTSGGIGDFHGRAFFDPSGYAVAWVSLLPRGVVKFSLGTGD
jgi:hypothetical protein